MTKATKRKYIRNPFGSGYQSDDGKWLIQTEGTPTYWYAVQLGEDSYPIDETKSYWRSVQQCKDFIAWKETTT